MTISKNEQIGKTLKETRDRHRNMDCVVFEIKIQNNKISKQLQSKTNLLFLEAKWLYNYILSQENVFDFNTKIKSVDCLTPNGLENRDLNIIGSQIKQDIHKRLKDSIKALSTKKKKGNTKQIGRLKFKSEVNSIPLKQFQNTYKIKGNRISIQGLGKFKVNGLNQLKEINKKDIANANFIRKNNDLYLKITCFKPKPEIKECKYFIGIDFGIKDSMVFSNGSKLDTKIQLSKSVLTNHKKLSKKQNKSKNQEKQRIKLKKSYAKILNKRKEIRSQLKHHLKTEYQWIAVQNENIKGWYSGLFGKQIQQSTIGGIIREIKMIPHTSIVDRFYASTQECPCCLKKVKQSLDKRIYKCSCGYTKDRDVHSARNILLESLKIPLVQRKSIIEKYDKKPVENKTSIKFFNKMNNLVSLFNETGSPSL